MATRRMLHNKISRSMDVNKLDLEAQLLFTWLISHADDEGRLRGEPEYVKATVVPMKTWPFEEISNYLLQMKTLGLIYYWEHNDIKIIEFTKWNEHQMIRSDRFKHSELPPYDNQAVTSSQPTDNQMTAQVNTSEDKEEEVKKSEVNLIADKSFTDPNDYPVSNPDEYAALEAWKKLEPDNKSAFFTTYLPAVRKGVKADSFYRFASEIHQDKTIKNKGSVFQSKVKSIIK